MEERRSKKQEASAGNRQNTELVLEEDTGPETPLLQIADKS